MNSNHMQIRHIVDDYSHNNEWRIMNEPLRIFGIFSTNFSVLLSSLFLKESPFDALQDGIQFEKRITDYFFLKTRCNQ